MDDLLYGRRTVSEALSSDRGFNRILISGDPHHPPIADIIDKARNRGIPFQLTDRKRLDALCQATHQGVVAFVAAHAYTPLEDILAGAGRSGDPPLVIVLDRIQDPNNLGAIIRTSAATCVDGVIIPKRSASGVTPAVAKASAGAVERIPVAQVSNISASLKILKDEGFWTVGLGQDFPVPFTDIDFRSPTALVLGGEERGIRPLVQRGCDHLIHIPTAPESQSLNASVAAALVLYEAFRQRKSRDQAT